MPMTDFDPDDEWDVDTDEPAASVVRPYTFTSGRTTSRVAVPMEAAVELTISGRARHWPIHDPNSRIIDLCVSGRLSVAEISARAGLAIGVTRVLIGDLAADGYVQLQHTLSDSASSDERVSLIERTLRGLRDL